MDKQRTVVQDYRTCDGCDYMMGDKHPPIVVTVPPGGLVFAELVFHFHALTNRHDCFRYWAHNPSIMRKSLAERELDDQQIDEFMSMMLYREGQYAPGIPRAS